MNSNHGCSPEALLAETAWLRALVRSLVRGEALAEDICQDTLLATWGRPSEVRGSLRSWLARVARNKITRAFLGDLRRRRREQQAARSEALPSTAAVVEHFHLQLRLAHGVDALGEPYRTVILLRFSEDLSPREIARRLSVPVETVRTRIKRGLAMLRTKLDADCGGRAAWLLPLGNWRSPGVGGGSEGVGGLTALVQSFCGVLLMSMKTKVLVGAAAAVIAALVVWSLAYGNPDKSAPRTTEVAARALIAHGAPEVQASTSTRETVWSSSRKLQAAKPTDLLPLRGIVLDQQRQPIAGARVEGRRRPFTSYVSLSTDLWGVVETIASMHTDRDGRFELQWLRGQPCELLVTAGRARKLVAECYGEQDLTIVLEAGATLQGRIGRKHDLAALEGVGISLVGAGPPGPHVITKSGPDGRYVFTDLQPGTVALIVIPTDGEPQSPRIVRLKSGELYTEDFVISAGPVTRGRVTDANTGAPLPGAEVGLDWTFARSVYTDGNGEFEQRGFPSASYQQLSVRAEGYARYSINVGAGAEQRVNIALVPAGAVQGRIRDAEGNAIAEAIVSAAASGQRAGQSSAQGIDFAATRSAADGTFVLRNLRVDILHALQIRKQGLGTATYDFPRQAVSGLVLDLGDFVLLQSGVLEGRVVDTSKQPLAGCDMTLQGTNADRARLVPSPAFGTAAVGTKHPRQQNAGEFYVMERRTKSDAAGRFRFADLAAGEYAIEVRVPSGAAQSNQRSPVQLRAGEVMAMNDLVVDLALAIKGRVQTSTGLPVPRVYIMLMAEQPQQPEGNHSTGTSENGSFAVTGLRGKYRLHVTCNASDPQARAWSDVCLEGVAAGTHDLLITLPPSEWIRGKVLDDNGQPARGVRVWGRYAEVLSTFARSVTVPTAVCNEAGEFEMRVQPGTVVDLRVEWTTPTPGASVMVSTSERGVKKGVRAGSIDVVLR